MARIYCPAQIRAIVRIAILPTVCLFLKNYLWVKAGRGPGLAHRPLRPPTISRDRSSRPSDSSQNADFHGKVQYGRHWQDIGYVKR